MRLEKFTKLIKNSNKNSDIKINKNNNVICNRKKLKSVLSIFEYIINGKKIFKSQVNIFIFTQTMQNISSKISDYFFLFQFFSDRQHGDKTL